MKKIYLYIYTEVSTKDFKLIDDFEDYEIERITSDRISLKEWISNYTPCSFDDDIFIVISRPFLLGSSLDEFMTNGLQCIEKGLKVVFKCRLNLSFHRLIDYKVFTTIEQQKVAFLSLYSIVMTDIYSHKAGRKRDSKTVKLLRNYWLAYIYKNARKFKGLLSTIEIANNLKISSKTLQALKNEIDVMLANDKQEELENMVINELYSKKACNTSEHTEAKNLRRFEERLVNALSKECTQLDYFTSEVTDDREN